MLSERRNRRKYRKTASFSRNLHAITRGIVKLMKTGCFHEFAPKSGCFQRFGVPFNNFLTNVIVFLRKRDDIFQISVVDVVTFIKYILFFIKYFNKI